MTEIIFLGTSSMVPTKERNHTGILIRYKDDGILIDCGEGIQRQFKVAGIPVTRVTKLLITHWHGDHVLGIPGLIQTLGASEYSSTLEIYGPPGTKKYFEHMFKAFLFDRKIEIEINEIEKDGIFADCKGYILECYKMNHSTPAYGYSFIEKDRRRIQMTKARKLGIKEGPELGKLADGKEISFKEKKIKPDDVSYIVKGKKISFTGDTGLCSNLIKLAKESDVFISEATFHSELEKRGEKYMHMTAKQAAEISHNANVDKLILTHFSARYKDSGDVLKDAKDLFPNVAAAYDFLKIKL